MQAIILAGGKGTRLRPLTLNLPKPVVPFVNRPLLNYQLDLLTGVGFKEATLSLSYEPEKIQEVMAGITGEIALRYVVEETPLGTGGAVRYALRKDSGTVVVFNGDILNDLDLAAVLAFHREKKAGVTIVLTEVDDPTNYGLVETHADGRVRQFLEKPGWNEIDSLRTINAGTYIIEPEYLDLIRGGAHVSIEREFFPLLVEREAPFYAFLHRGYWIDIGTVAKYLKAHHDFFLRGGAIGQGYREVRRNVWVADGAAVPASVEAHGPLVAGPASVVGEGAVFSRFCVVGAGCRIGAGAHLDGCVLWQGVSVGEGARLKGCVLGEGSSVGDHARLSALFALGGGGRIPDYSHFSELEDEFWAD
jgi:NDP-sugar pyrophosphorylase family protein